MHYSDNEKRDIMLMNRKKKQKMVIKMVGKDKVILDKNVVEKT